MEVLLTYCGLYYKYVEEAWDLGYRLKEKWLRILCFHAFPRWVTPNGVTYLRMAGAGVVYHLYSHDFSRLLIILLVIFAVVSDVIDGPLARVRGQESIWGANIDPIADKMIIFVVAYFELIDAMPTIFWIIVTGEIVSTILRPLSFMMGFDAKANAWGKTKMVLQSFALLPVYLGYITVAVNVMILAFALGAVSLARQSLEPLKKLLRS